MNHNHYKARIAGGILGTIREREILDSKLDSQLKLFAQSQGNFKPQWKAAPLSPKEREWLINCAFEYSQLHPVDVPQFVDTPICIAITEKSETLGGVA